MYGCQQILIHANKEISAILEFICTESNKLTNCAIYYCRQMFFKAYKYVVSYDLDKMMKSNPHFRAMRSCCAQQTLHGVAESFKSSKRLAALYKKGQIASKPRLPKYRKKGGMAIVTYPARFVKNIDGQLKFTLGKQAGFAHAATLRETIWVLGFVASNQPTPLQCGII